MRVLLAACLLFMSAPSAGAAEPKVLNGEASFPEGPVVKDGKLYYAEYGAHKVAFGTALPIEHCGARKDAGRPPSFHWAMDSR
jgi:hypothetical protein